MLQFGFAAASETHFHLSGKHIVSFFEQAYRDHLDKYCPSDQFFWKRRTAGVMAHGTWHMAHGTWHMAHDALALPFARRLWPQFQLC
jgi:TRAP-type C4-dicarboxylate transport system permease small subunit